MNVSLEELFRDLTIRPITQRLVTNLLLGRPMDPPLIVDFGIDSDAHYRALRAIIFNDADMADSDDLSADDVEVERVAEAAFHTLIRELDDAYGNGPKLNALIKKHAPKYAALVKFETSWDEIYGRADTESGSKE